MLPLASETWDERERAAVMAVLDSGRFTMGDHVKRFESAFAEYFGARYAVMVNSGSSANLIGLAGLVHHPDIDLKAGDEVIVPAVSWSTTYFPVHQLGLKLRFVDVDPHTMNMSPNLVEAAITPRTRAILAVNLLGNPCDLPALKRLADERGLTLFEDNCESMGATIEGRHAGTFGVAGTFSTFFSHHICTMEGGVVVTDDRKLYDTMVSLRAHGWLREQPANSHLQRDMSEFEKRFRFVLPGYNLRPLEMSGAVGVEQLKKLPGFVSARRDNARKFSSLFEPIANIRTQMETGESSWFGFGFILEGPLAGRRTELVAQLETAGVECRPVVTGNFLRNPVITLLDHSVSGEIVAADQIDQDGLFIGNHHIDVSAQLEKVATLCSDFSRAAA